MHTLVCICLARQVSLKRKWQLPLKCMHVRLLGCNTHWVQPSFLEVSIPQDLKQEKQLWENGKGRRHEQNSGKTGYQDFAYSLK